MLPYWRIVILVLYIEKKNYLLYNKINKKIKNKGGFLWKKKK